MTDKPTRKESRIHARETARKMRLEEQKKEKRNKIILWSSIMSIIIITVSVITLIMLNAPKPAEQQTPNNLLYGGFSLTSPTTPILNPAETQTERNPNNVYVDIYLDYLCPYCKMFEEAQADTFENVSNMNDNVVITYYPVPFLGNYSAVTSNAITCVAEYQPDIFWNTNKALLDMQPEDRAGRNLREEQTQKLVTDLFATFNVNEEVTTCVKDMRFENYLFEFAVYLSNNPAPFTDNILVDGTPFVIINGEAVPPQYFMEPEIMFSYIDDLAKTLNN